MIKISPFLIIVSLIFSSPLLAQTITGYVVNEDNEPVIGAQVMEAGSRNGTTSNIDGSFFLELEQPTSSLVFSFVGYEKDSLYLREGKLHQVVLKEQKAQESELAIVNWLSDYRVIVALIWTLICIWLVVRTFRGVASA